MKKLMLLVILMAGCASHSGVIADGKDAFIVIESGNSSTSAGDLKIAAYKEANAYCKKLNKRFESISEHIVRAGVLSRYSEVDVRFRCIAD
ncbi:MAG: hypothetical protein NUV63_07195 [Gallionella sp.]|nr:hypothetical protein [Gallionella sp.]